MTEAIGEIKQSIDKDIITPLKDQSLTLEQRLAQFDPDRHGGEAMISEQLFGVSYSNVL